MNKLNYINHIFLSSLLILSAGCSSSDKESKKDLKTSLPTIDTKPSPIIKVEKIMMRVIVIRDQKRY